MDDRQLVLAYQKQFDLRSSTFIRIDHDDAMIAIVYKIVKQNGEELILKICERPNDYWREVYFLDKFADLLPVPRMIAVSQPNDRLFGAILMECLPGDLLQLADFTGTLAYDIGSMLAKIHLHRMPSYGDPVVANSLHSDPRVYFTLKFEEGLGECENHLPQALIEKIREYYENNVHLLTSVDGPCIVHRDFRPGNLIVYNGKLSGIIDWSSARISFAEEDFCSMEHGEWPDRCKEPFIAGYESVRPVPNYSNLMPLLRLNKAIAIVGFTVKSGTWNGSDSKLYELNRHFITNFKLIN